ncbi:MAG: IS1 family transposase [Microcoleaceae cyanobacterium]
MLIITNQQQWLTPLENNRVKSKSCSCQYVLEHPTAKGYPLKVKQLCIKMYLNGMGIFGYCQSYRYQPHYYLGIGLNKQHKRYLMSLRIAEIPEITEIDQLQTFVGRKKNKYWIVTVVNHNNKGIIVWTIGDHSHQTFELIGLIIKCWHSFCYVTDGWKVYPMYIDDIDHQLSKTYIN